MCFVVIDEWIYFQIEPICAAELIWYALKLHLWVLWNLHDEIDMLILHDQGQLTRFFEHIMNVMQMIIYKPRLRYVRQVKYIFFKKNAWFFFAWHLV